MATMDVNGSTRNSLSSSERKANKAIRDEMKAIAELTGLPVPHRLPGIVMVNRRFLINRLKSDHPEIRARDIRIQALYCPNTKRICLHESWDATDPEHHSIFVHELVHYMQDKADVPWDSDRIEEEAYRVQNIFLERCGLSLALCGYEGIDVVKELIEAQNKSSTPS